MLCLQETWFSEVSHLIIPNFNLVVSQPRCDTTNNYFGGSAIYARSSPNVNVVYATKCSPSPDCQITIAIINHITYINIYRSPSQPEENIQKLLKFIKSADYANLVIVGDLNFPHVNWSSMSSNHRMKNKILEAINGHGLLNFVQQATHLRGNLLDVVLSQEGVVYDVEVGSDLEFPSDHYPITFSVESPCEEEGKVRSVNLYKDFKSEEYKERLRSVNWFQLNYKDVDEATDIITKTILNAYDASLPKRFITSDKPIEKFSPRIVAQIKACQYFKRNNKKDELREAQIILNELIQEQNKFDVEKYLEGLEANKMNIYNVFKKNKFKNQVTCTRKSDGTITYDENEVVEILNDHFASVLTNSVISEIDWEDEENMILNDIDIHEDLVLQTIKSTKSSFGVGPDLVSTHMLKEASNHIVLPLTLLFRQCIKAGVVPKAFREASVSPIPKKGDCSFQKNVRGICKESVIGKTLEKIVQKSMYEALEADDYFPESQFGFRKGRGCQQNLEIFHNFIHDALDNGFKVVVCFADLSRAFDIVDHDLVLKSIFKAGIRGRIGRYIQAWLSGRTQFTKFKEVTSSVTEVNSSIIQGSNLATLLFLCLKNELPNYIRHSALIDYADDSKIAFKYKNDEDMWKFEQDMASFQQWAIDAKQCLNLTKTKIIHFGPKLTRNIYLNSVLISVEDSITDLGVDISGSRAFQDHHDKIHRRMCLATHAARKTIKGASFKIRSFVYQTYIYPLYNFACTLWWNKDIANRLDHLYKKFFQDAKPAETDFIPLSPSQSFIRSDLIDLLKKRQSCKTYSSWVEYCTNKTDHGKRCDNLTDFIPPLPRRTHHQWPAASLLSRARERWNQLCETKPITYMNIEDYVRSEQCGAPGYLMYAKLSVGELRSAHTRLKELRQLENEDLNRSTSW